MFIRLAQISWVSDSLTKIGMALAPTTEIISNIKPFKRKNQIFHYTHITPKHVTGWQGPPLCHCGQATKLFLKKCHRGGELLATLCSILNSPRFEP